MARVCELLPIVVITGRSCGGKPSRCRQRCQRHLRKKANRQWPASIDRFPGYPDYDDEAWGSDDEHLSGVDIAVAALSTIMSRRATLMPGSYVVAKAFEVRSPNNVGGYDAYGQSSVDGLPQLTENGWASSQSPTATAVGDAHEARSTMLPSTACNVDGDGQQETPREDDAATGDDCVTPTSMEVDEDSIDAVHPGPESASLCISLNETKSKSCVAPLCSNEADKRLKKGLCLTCYKTLLLANFDVWQQARTNL